MPLRYLPLLLLAATPVAAQRPDTLAETVVTARHGLSEATLGTASVAVVPMDGAVSVADALGRGTTVFVRPLGLTGLASMSVRGTGSSQTAVLLDGLRLTDPQLGQLDLRLLPAALLGGARLVSGSGSAFDGSDAMGGTLLLASRTGIGVGGAVEAGSFGTFRADAHGGVSSRRFVVNAAASAESIRGDFPYPDPVYQTTARREGADLRLASLLVRATTPRTALGLWLAAADRGLAPSAGTPATDERQTDGLARVWTAHTRPARNGSLRLAGYAHASRLRYTHPGLSIDDTGRTQTLGGEVERTWVLSRGWEEEPLAEAGLGVAASTARATHPSLADDAREHALAAFAHATQQRGRWTLAPALRLDVYLREPKPMAATSPRLGLRYAIGGGFAARTSVAAAFRAPTLNDRFWNGAGRPDLRPERARLAELGVTFDRRTGVETWHGEATAFAHSLRDQIVWTPDVTGRFRPENILRTRTVGIEAGGRWALRDDFGRPEVDASLAVTHAVDRSDSSSPTYGRQLRYVPRVVARAGARVSPGRFAFDLNARYVGTRFATADESQALAPALTVDAAASVRAGALRLGLRLDNLLDTRYHLLDGYPMPGRAVYIRLGFGAP